MRASLCAVCGEDTIIKKPGHILGRACRCEREKQAQAVLDKSKPRCGAVTANHPNYQERCGDHDGHEGPHSQGLVLQVMK